MTDLPPEISSEKLIAAAAHGDEYALARRDLVTRLTDEQPAASRYEPFDLVCYDGSFELRWLWDDEQVKSAGDGTGACIIVSPDGERRVNIGDLIEVCPDPDAYRG